MLQNLWESLKQSAIPIPRVSDAAGLGWDPKICISNKYSGGTDATVPTYIL